MLDAERLQARSLILLSGLPLIVRLHFMIGSGPECAIRFLRMDGQPEAGRQTT
jgi:hypothetical protein